MRIGMISGEYPPMRGGVGAFTRILSSKMADHGHEVFIYSASGAQETDLRLHLDNSARWNMSGLRSIERWASSRRLDVINLQYQTAAYGMSPFVHFIPDRVRAAPVITTFHDLRHPYLFPKAGKFRHWIVAHLARSSKACIATNHEDLQQLQALGLSNTQMIPIGSNILPDLPSNFQRAYWREKAGAHSGDFLIAFFGLLNSSKGIDVLLRAVKSLRDDGIPAKLVIIGDTGSSDPTNQKYADQIEREIAALDLASAVQKTGFVEDIKVGSFLTVSDCTALPFRDGASYRRGSLMAAIHYGCPIVTTEPTIAIPEFQDGANMLLVPIGDTSQLTSALKKLHESASLRTTLSQGAKLLAEQFDWETIARQTAAFYEQVLR